MKNVKMRIEMQIKPFIFNGIHDYSQNFLKIAINILRDVL